MTTSRPIHRTYPQLWNGGARGFLYYHNKRPIPASEALINADCVRKIDKDARGLALWRCCRCNYESWNNENHVSCRICEHEPCDICYIRHAAEGQDAYSLIDDFKQRLSESNDYVSDEPHDVSISNHALATKFEEREMETAAQSHINWKMESHGPEEPLNQVIPSKSHTDQHAVLRPAPVAKPVRDAPKLAITTSFSPLSDISNSAISPNLTPGEKAKIWLQDWAHQMKEMLLEKENNKRHKRALDASQTAEEAPRPIWETEGPEQGEETSPDSFAIAPSYAFDKSWLEEAGVISKISLPANNLTCDVHPLLAFHHWQGCRREVWTWMQPALRLASMCLTTPSSMSFWIQLFHGARTRHVRPDMRHDQEYATWYIQSVHPRSKSEDHSNAIEAIDKLKDLGEDWTWVNWSWSRRNVEVSDTKLIRELDEEATELTGLLLCRSHKAVLEGEFCSEDSSLFPTEIEAHGPSRRSVHIKLENDLLEFIEKAMTDQGITGNQILCFNLHFATVILHNLAHAVEQFLTYEYYKSNNLLRVQEPSMSPFQVAECGDNYLRELMEGACEPVGSDFSYAHGLYLIDVSFFYRGEHPIASHNALGLPMHIVSHFQQQSYWDSPDVNGLRGVILEHEWPQALKPRYVPPYQSGDASAEEGLYLVPELEGADTPNEEQDPAAKAMNDKVRKVVTQPLPKDEAGAPPINASTYSKLTLSERERLRAVLKPYWDASVNEMLETHNSVVSCESAIMLAEDNQLKPLLENKRSTMISLLESRIEMCAAAYWETLKDSLKGLLKERKMRSGGMEVELDCLTEEDVVMIDLTTPKTETIFKHLQNAVQKLSPRSAKIRMIQERREVGETALASVSATIVPDKADAEMDNEDPDPESSSLDDMVSDNFSVRMIGSSSPLVGVRSPTTEDRPSGIGEKFMSKMFAFPMGPSRDMKIPSPSYIQQTFNRQDRQHLGGKGSHDQGQKYGSSPSEGLGDEEDEYLVENAEYYGHANQY